MPLWNDSSASPTPPKYLKGLDAIRVYATYKGWVLWHPGAPVGREEILVSSGANTALDTRIAAPAFEGVLFSANTSLYKQGSNAYVTTAYNQTVSVLESVAYTGIAGGPFVNAEIITQGGANIGKVLSANSTVLTVYTGGAKAVGAGVQPIVTANVATKITGVTSGATANVSSITAPTLNVSVTGALTQSVVATYGGPGTSNNHLRYYFAVPSFVDNILTITGTANGSFTVGDPITQVGGASGTISAANSSQISVNNSIGVFVVSGANTTLLVRDSTTGATANVTAVVSNTITLSIAGQTIATNTSVNFAGNNTVNAVAVFAGALVLPVDNIKGATANVIVS